MARGRVEVLDVRIEAGPSENLTTIRIGMMRARIDRKGPRHKAAEEWAMKWGPQGEKISVSRVMLAEANSVDPLGLQGLQGQVLLIDLELRRNLLLRHHLLLSRHREELSPIVIVRGGVMLQAAESIPSRWEIRQEMQPVETETTARVDMVLVLTSAVTKTRGKLKIKGRISALSRAGGLRVAAAPAKLTGNKDEERVHRRAGLQISKWWQKILLGKRFLVSSKRFLAVLNFVDSLFAT